MTRHAHVAVIGGGIYGCGVLYHLVEQGWRDVLLLEKNELTAGSTWHAAGFCTHYSFNVTHGLMRRHSSALYERLEREGGEPTGFHRCGGLRLTSDPARMDEFRHGLSVGRQMGVAFELLDPGDIERRCPLLDARGLLGGLYEPLDGYVDPAQATQALARLARAGGATVLRHCPVQAIEPTSRGEWRLRTPDEEIVAEHVVIAAGFWAAEVGRLAGVDVPVVPMLHQYLVTEDHPQVAACAPGAIPLVRYHDRQWYLRREHDGLLLGAYESAPQTWSEDGVPPDFGMELLPAELERIEPLIGDALARVPVLAEAGVKTVVHGPVGYTPDGQALIGPAPGAQNLWLAAGSGFGIGEGAGAGWLLAEWMARGAPPLDMLAFDPRRFGAWADRAYRLAKVREVFAMQFAPHYPFEERPAGRPVRPTPLYPRLAEKGAVFGTRYGRERPNWFAAPGQRHDPGFRRSDWFDAVGAECRALAEAVGVIDLSAFGKFAVRGADARAELERLSANRLPRPGRLRLCHFLNPLGGVECEFTIASVDPERFYLVCAAAAEQHHLDWLHSHIGAGRDVVIRNRSDNLGALGVAGPRARELLQSLTKTDLSEAAFAWLGAQRIELAAVAVDALRVSYTGELGWELHHRIEDQLALYDLLHAAGAGLGLRDVGFYALESTRLEKGYRAWGHDLGVETGLVEAGLERFAHCGGRDFVGREHLLEPRAQGAARRLVHLRVQAREADALPGAAVFAKDVLAGVVTSGGYGHRVGASLALALVDAAHAGAEAPLAVEILGERCAAHVLETPPYDPASLRPRGLA